MQKNIFVVSCQALEDEPLHGKGIMRKMARAAIIGGADWIRTSQIDNINDIMEEVDVPVIGVIKKKYVNSEVFITPTLDELKKLIKTGVQIIALDATLRPRPMESLAEIVEYFNKNKQSHQKLMADCSNLEDFKNAITLHFDYISTTLWRYTNETKAFSNKKDYFAFINKIATLTEIPIVAEGGIETPAEARKAFQSGASIVVVGGAITRPRTIVARFIKKIRNED